MTEPLRLMGIFAHPDDESLGTGGTLAKYAAEGIETYLVTATRGEHGWHGEAHTYPGPDALGALREQELRAACDVLGVRRLDFLDYIDGDLDQAEPGAAIERIVTLLRQVRPQVVMSFGPDGAYGHPDHIAISQFATAALACVADAGYRDAHDQPPHRVAKLYYMTFSAALADIYQAHFGDLVMPVDGVERRGVVWPDWAITTRLDVTAHWETVWRAVACHRSQLPNYDVLARLEPQEHQRLWGCQEFYRVYSLVNGGRAPENDLFAGLR